jgi:hypothetical protein
VVNFNLAGFPLRLRVGEYSIPQTPALKCAFRIFATAYAAQMRRNPPGCTGFPGLLAAFANSHR